MKKKTKKIPSAGGKGKEGETKTLEELSVSLAGLLDFASPAVASKPLDEAALRLVGPEAVKLVAVIKQLRQRLSGLQPAAETLQDAVHGEDAPPSEEGSSSNVAYVEMKAQMLLSYLISLVYYLLLKVRGVPVREHAVVPRLIWIRTLLEKLRPVDQRLQYQMSRLVQLMDEKASVQGDEVDPHSLKPGALALSAADEDDEDEGADGEAAPAGPEEEDNIYRPPKVHAESFTGDFVRAKDKAIREEERQKRLMEQKETIRDLRQEFTDTPTEVSGMDKSSAAERAARKTMEREEYEMDNMVRIRSTRTEKKEMQKMMRERRTSGGGAVSLQDAVNFNDLAAEIEGATSGRQGKRGRGRTLGDLEAAAQRAKKARRVLESTNSGVMPEGLGGGGGRGSRPKRGK